MSDDLDIRSGGAIAVDTESLRQAAGVLAVLAEECAALCRALVEAGAASQAASLWNPSSTHHAGAALEQAGALARALRARADAYELIESDAVRQAGAIGVADPALAEATRLWEQWRGERHAELERQIIAGYGLLGSITGLLLTMPAAVRALDRGVLESGAPPLRGDADPTRVREHSRAAATAPASLVDVAERMPGGRDERVRVEVYEMADGRREYAVYITGTRALGGDEPWDMGSNLDLYFGRDAASYDAVERALAASGAVAGDRLHIAGHSQGGMLGTHLARQGGFDVATLVTFASPVQAELPASVLTVAVRHTDDPVAALAAGGLAGIAGSPESFIVERVADPIAQPSDVTLRVHGMDSYRETAAMVDASDDPRVDALRTQWTGLGAAVSVTAITYSARREPEDERRRRR